MDKISLLISEYDIKKRVTEIAQKISMDYEGEKITIVSVLKGAFVFTADLIRSINNDTDINFIRAKSYIDTKSSGDVNISDEFRLDVKGKTILIVEDIIDTGKTLYDLKEYFFSAGCKDVKIAVFLDKPSRRTADVSPDYCCFQIEDKFVVGYGLDYNEKYRQLPYLGILTPGGN
ncbi:MAG: hypoxanthine phosphoribosyltransferase [Ruminococcus sp.]|nr:hypoxanthine phosphoribosyltransferase [Ruminococcus sp.]